MKILQVNFENINSLKGKHQINFEEAPLKDAGLFAITGPTGSGKTTILDVICLALYNEIPRMGKISKSTIENSGSVITRNTDQASAYVTYQCNEGVFTSEWSISHNRNNNLRDYEMNLYDSSNRPLGLKKGEIPGHNAKLIGLEYEQFVRSMMLAQGDFAQFLKSNEKDRAKLLEKITGTFIYRELGKKAFEKAKELKKKTSEIDLLINDRQSQLLDDEDFAKKEVEYKSTLKELKNKQLEEKKLDDAIKLKNELEEIIKRKGDTERLLEGNKNALVDFEQNEGIALQKHKKLAPYREDLTNWKDYKGQIQGIKERINTLNPELKSSKESQEKLLESINKLTKANCSNDNAIDQLNSFYEKYLEIDREKSELLNQFQIIKNSLSKYELASELKSDVNKPDLIIVELEELSKEKSNELSSLNEKISKNPFYGKEELLSVIGEILTQIRNSEMSIAQLEKELSKIENKQTELQEDLKGLPQSIENKTLLKDKLSAEINQLRTAVELKKLRASLEEHRKNLEEGKPCPLCGSEHHPWAEEAPHSDFHHKELLEKESDLEIIKDELAKAQTNQTGLEKQLNGLIAENSKAKDDLSEAKKLNQTARKSLPVELQKSLTETIEQERESYRELLNKAEKFEKHLNEVGKILPDLHQMRKIKQEGLNKKDTLMELYNDNAPLSELKKSISEKWGKYQNTILRLGHEKTEREKEKDKLELAVENIEKSLLPNLHKLDYPSIETAFKDLLPYPEENRLVEKFEKLNNDVSKSKNDLNHFKEEITKKQDQDIDVNKEELEIKLSDLSKDLQRLDETSKTLFADIDRQEKNLEFIAKKEQEKEDIIGEGEKWLLLEKLIGDKTGSKFSTFAQQLTLEQLILLANRRLSGFSKRYLLAKGEQEDLIAIDQDMGNQERSVKTLSGGETFLISLSLALALSDLASKNIRIESMFIDEGFGTLDPETLDLTLDVLERLQSNDNRTIGIISHVDALKERISSQIRVKPIGQGYSKLEITGA